MQNKIKDKTHPVRTDAEDEQVDYFPFLWNLYGTYCEIYKTQSINPFIAYIYYICIFVCLFSALYIND